MITWNELTREEQKQCMDDIYTVFGPDLHGLPYRSKESWMIGYQRGLENASKEMASILREAANGIEKIKTQ